MSRKFLPAVAAAALFLWPLQSLVAAEIRLSFHPQTGFVAATLGGDAGTVLALAGRSNDATPVLALLRYRDGVLEQRQLTLPDNAVAIDAGPAAYGVDALFVLCTDRVLRVTGFDAEPETLAPVTSMFRGRSFAELTDAIDFARDIDGDGVADLLIQDFDTVNVAFGPRYAAVSALALPSIRRGFDSAATYRPVRIAAASVDGARSLLAVRGNTLLRFDADGDGYLAQPIVLPLSLGLSEERDIEAFYNGYDSIDQSEIVLREPELLRDLNDDGLPDLVTLETASTGVFDKQSTYRVHLARVSDGIRYDAEPDSLLSSSGFQFGLRAEPINGERVALVSPGVEVGLGTIIRALFTKSVTMGIAIHAPDEQGRIPAEPSTTVKTRISFDFGSGRAELPTIAFGDFDGDGRNDLLLKRSGSEVVWRRNIGDGQFERDGRELEIRGPSDGTAVIAADLDGDDRSEVIVRYSKADGDDRDRVIRVLPVSAD